MSAPKLRTGLEVVSLPDGAAVVNGGKPVLFRGRAATDLLVPLLVALDGIADVELLASKVGASEAHVSRGLQLLADSDLLEVDA